MYRNLCIKYVDRKFNEGSNYVVNIWTTNHGHVTHFACLSKSKPKKYWCWQLGTFGAIILILETGKSFRSARKDGKKMKYSQCIGITLNEYYYK